MKALSSNYWTASKFPKIMYFLLAQETSFWMLSLGQWGMFTLVILKNWTQATTSKSDSVCFPDPPTGCWDASSSVPPSYALREAALSPRPFTRPSAQPPNSTFTRWLGISTAGPAGTLHSSQPKRTLDAPWSHLTSPDLIYLWDLLIPPLKHIIIFPLSSPLAQWFSTRNDFAPQGALDNVETRMVVMSVGEGLLEPVGKVSGTAGPTMDRTTSITQNCLAPNVSSAEAEEHCSGPSQQRLSSLWLSSCPSL